MGGGREGGWEGGEGGRGGREGGGDLWFDKDKPEGGFAFEGVWAIEGFDEGFIILPPLSLPSSILEIRLPFVGTLNFGILGAHLRGLHTRGLQFKP